MRLLISAAGTAMIMALTLLPAPAAQAAAAVFVELNPSTVRAGDQVSVRASCADNKKAATVSAEPIGSVPVEPEFGFLTATVKVPDCTSSPAGSLPDFWSRWIVAVFPDSCAAASA